MGVSKNRGIPKWMVKIMENPIKMDDLGGKPTIWGYPYFWKFTHLIKSKATLRFRNVAPLDKFRFFDGQFFASCFPNRESKIHQDSWNKI